MRALGAAAERGERKSDGGGDGARAFWPGPAAIARAVPAAPGRGGPAGNRGEGTGLNRPDRSWIGRRWFEMRTGYITYLAFTFGFGNFVLILHGLTDWFKDYPLHWFAIAMLAVIIPAAVLIGHRHNRTQQKTETRNLTHLNPYIDTVIPNSKEVMSIRTMIAQADWMIEMAKDEEIKERIRRVKAACIRVVEGEPATGALDAEGAHFGRAGGEKRG